MTEKVFDDSTSIYVGVSKIFQTDGVKTIQLEVVPSRM
jgi:hypothetical protein